MTMRWKASGGGDRTRTCIAFRPAVFQDRKVGLNLIEPTWIYQYKSGCAAIKVIEVPAGSFPSARHLSANFCGPPIFCGAFIARPHTRKRVCLTPLTEWP